MAKLPITGLTKRDLEEVLAKWGEPPYRAKQIGDWLYRKPIQGFAEMTNLSQALRDRLAAECQNPCLRAEEHKTALQSRFCIVDCRMIE